MDFSATWIRYTLGEVKMELGKTANVFSLWKYASKEFTLIRENREIKLKVINQR